VNAALSLCACAAADKKHRALLEAIQQQIFWFSAELGFNPRVRFAHPLAGKE
jgi:cob(I)alamin adenosyltransferase